MLVDWKTSDGHLLPYEHWEPLGPVKGVILCVHGMGGASDNFDPLGLSLSQDGYAIYAVNLRGEGNDPRIEKRGAELNLADISADLLQFSEMLRGQYPNVPHLVLGESMGALILLHVLATTNNAAGWAGAIFSVPVIALIKPIPWYIRFLVRVLCLVVPNVRFYPAWFISGKTESLPLTRDKAYQDAIKTKPHYIRAFTFQFLEALASLIERSDTVAKQIELPCLVLAAGKDCFVRSDQVEAWFAKLKAKDKTLLKYPEAYHLLWHDWQAEEVRADMQQWIRQRTGQVVSTANV